jgi:predicted amidohydrolase YtcJ
MKIILNIFSVLTLLFICGCTSPESPADMIILGKIYTGIENKPVIGAVAVTGEKIIFTGSKEESEKYLGDQTEVINLNEKVMTPGFIEGHAHLVGVGENEMNLDLIDVRNYDDLIEKVKEAVSKSKPGTWIVGRGWHQDKWDRKPEKIVKGFQTHDQLSEVSPDNPVYLTHASGHAAMANAKAMQVAGISSLGGERFSTNIKGSGGEIIRDELGNPTGIFIETATDLIAAHIPKNDPDRNKKAIELALQACLRNGLTGFHDAGASRGTIDLLLRLRDEGALPVRLNVMLGGSDRDLVREWYKKGPYIDSSYRLTIRSIKLYCDGALGSRGAWLLEPYSDRKETSGMSIYPMDTVLQTARGALKSGFQLCTHGIGDRANREILDTYELALRENPTVKDHRFRIEHAQHIDPADIPRFGRLGVIPAMQAIHMSSDRPWAINRLGETRIREGAYMWQSLLRSGARIVNGTDAPVEPLNPLACFYASVSRKTLKGEPEGGYEPDEKMTRAQALRSYTLDPAYAEFAEKVKGTIEAGKYADFTVFSKDLMTVPEDQILTTEVEMTIVAGKLLYVKK